MMIGECKSSDTSRLLAVLKCSQKAQAPANGPAWRNSSQLKEAVARLQPGYFERGPMGQSVGMQQRACRRNCWSESVSVGVWDRQPAGQSAVRYVLTCSICTREVARYTTGVHREAGSRGSSTTKSPSKRAISPVQTALAAPLVERKQGRMALLTFSKKLLHCCWCWC